MVNQLGRANDLLALWSAKKLVQFQHHVALSHKGDVFCNFMSAVHGFVGQLKSHIVYIPADGVLCAHHRHANMQ